MGLDVYEIVTERIMTALANGVVPWHKPWAASDVPMNFASKKPYRGINRLLLGLSEYASPWWVTYKQAAERGAQVRKGETSSLVVFFKRIEVENKQDPTAEPESHFLLRYYRVFNAEQVDGLDVPAVDEGDTELTSATAADIVAQMPNAPRIIAGGGSASYSPGKDVVRIPKHTTFDSEAAYYSTLFHELTHATGHTSRLNRFADASPFAFGDKGYAREELVAEMGAAFLLTAAGLGTQVEYDNSAAYIASWLKRLQDDKRLVVTAANRAEKAADFILAKTPELAQVAS